MPDYAIGTTFSFKFTTKKNGVATSLSGGTVVAYVGNSAIEITAGITLTADFDGAVGLNDVTVVATSGNGYTASDISFVLTAGTLGGTNAFPACVGEFQLERESALRPTVAGRSIDISTTGEAGVDWANVGSPTTTLNLSGTTIKTSTDVETIATAIKAKTDNLPEGIKKNTALSNFEFFLASSSDHVTAATGLTVTATRSIDGGAFASCTNSVSEVGSGVYKIDLAAADVNGTVVTLLFTAAGADALAITVKTCL